jgi:hypothetical protein
MRAPLAPGTAIDEVRYSEWISRFGHYRDAITPVTIESWLKQFKDKDGDKDLAARILDAVEFYGQSQIRAAFREVLKAMPGWDLVASKRTGKWRFAAMSGSAGESGDAMLYEFRIANGLTSKRFEGLFASRSDLFRQPGLPKDDPHRLGANDTVVLVDDFSGTGTQICDAWNDPATSFGTLLAGVGTVYMVLVAASKAARKRILDETLLTPVPAYELRDTDSVFSERCVHFTKADQDRLLHYGKKADRKNPKGFGGCGFVVVFQHRPPNNSIPILHRRHSGWRGLFPRHE